MAKEILDIADIKLLVDSFYAKVRKDDLLAYIFNQNYNGPDKISDSIDFRIPFRSQIF